MQLDFKPKLEKIVELLLYLAHKKPGADKYQVVKLFYLADKAHLERFGRPITFENYFALPYGPVASKAKDLIEKNPYVMKQAGIKSLPFELMNVESKGPDNSPLTVLGEPHREVDFDIFSKSDIKVFDEIIDAFGEKSFEELYSLTHSHAAYKNAWNKRGSAKSYPMEYSEMIESDDLREKIIGDFGQVASRI